MLRTFDVLCLNCLEVKASIKIIFSYGSPVALKVVSEIVPWYKVLLDGATASKVLSTVFSKVISSVATYVSPLAATELKRGTV